MPKTKEIREWRDLEQWGIGYLTAEADGLSMRGLFDVTKDGIKLLEQFFGVANLTPWPPRNPDVNGVKSDGSMFLARSLFLDLAAFCLLQDNDIAVIVPYQRTRDWQVYEHVVGYSQAEFDNFRTKERLYEWRPVWKGGTASGGFRNRHEWTGRVE